METITASQIRKPQKFGFAAAGAFVLAGLLSAAISTSAQAASVTADLNSLTGRGFAFTIDGNDRNTTAGIFDWTRTGGDAAAPLGNFKSVCVELDQSINIGAAYTYDVIETAEGPKPGIALGAGPMGDAKAKLLAKLWANYMATALTSKDAAASFQVAAWEIVYDDDNDLFAGGFQARYADLGSAPAFVQTAQTWLDSLAGLTDTAMLKVLTSRTHQDQLVMVPLPAAAWAGLSLIGAMGLRRKLRKA